MPLSPLRPLTHLRCVALWGTRASSISNKPPVVPGLKALRSPVEDLLQVVNEFFKSFEVFKGYVGEKHIKAEAVIV